MIKNKISIPLLSILAFICSCTTELPIDFNSSDKQYVINCLHKRGEPLSVYAHSSEAFTTAQASVATNLKMTLHREGQLQGTARLLNDSVYTFAYAPEGNTASILIEDTIIGKQFSAELESMHYVYLRKAVYYENLKIYDADYDGWFNKVSIEFNDEPDIDNYYEVILFAGERNCYSTIINSSVFSKGSQDTFTRTLFTDELFKNDSLQLSVYVYDKCDKVCLRNVSKSYYDYFTSLNAHLNSQNVLIGDDTPMDLFFRPLPSDLYSNVDGALGVFASYTEVQLSVIPTQLSN